MAKPGEMFIETIGEIPFAVITSDGGPFVGYDKRNSKVAYFAIDSSSYIQKWKFCGATPHEFNSGFLAELSNSSIKKITDWVLGGASKEEEVTLELTKLKADTHELVLENSRLRKQIEMCEIEIKGLDSKYNRSQTAIRELRESILNLVS